LCASRPPSFSRKIPLFTGVVPSGIPPAWLRVLSSRPLRHTYSMTCFFSSTYYQNAIQPPPLFFFSTGMAATFGVARSTPRAIREVTSRRYLVRRAPASFSASFPGSGRATFRRRHLGQARPVRFFSPVTNDAAFFLYHFPPDDLLHPFSILRVYPHSL